MFSVAPLMAYIVAPDIAIYVFIANLLAEWLGAVVFGRLADIYGRRPVFTLALSTSSVPRWNPDSLSGTSIP